MRLWIFSDLHLEFSPLEEPLAIPDADVCVVAGDILTKGIVPSIEWLAANIGKHMPVVFVAGNHEFYRSFMTESLDVASRVGHRGGVYFLENTSVAIGDIIFCGGTLWTDFGLLGSDWRELAMRKAELEMSDYAQIKFRKNPYARLRATHTYRRHIGTRRFLERALEIHDGKKIVFVTHHAPSPASIEEKYAGDLLNTAFASDLGAILTEKQPLLWVHGHVHHYVDYKIADTRVVANPRGYPGEVSFKNFNPALVPEL